MKGSTAGSFRRLSKSASLSGWASYEAKFDNMPSFMPQKMKSHTLSVVSKPNSLLIMHLSQRVR